MRSVTTFIVVLALQRVTTAATTSTTTTTVTITHIMAGTLALLALGGGEESGRTFALFLTFSDRRDGHPRRSLDTSK